MCVYFPYDFILNSFHYFPTKKSLLSKESTNFHGGEVRVEKRQRGPFGLLVAFEFAGAQVICFLNLVMREKIKVSRGASSTNWD